MLSTGPSEILDSVPGYALWTLLISTVMLAAFLWTRRTLPAQATLRQPVGSRVAMAISENFAPSDRFAGFVDENSGASVVVVELPGEAYEQFKRLGDTTQAFEAQGLAEVERVDLPGREGDYICLRGRQKTALVDYAKYVLIFPENGVTVMVTANIPEAALASGALAGAEIGRIFRSATVKAHIQETAALFKLGYLGPFEEDFSLLGTTKGYRLRGAPAPNPDDTQLHPIFLVAPSLTQAPIPNLAFFAERSFHGIAQMRDKVVSSTNEVTIAGRDGVEVVGTGIDQKSGERCLVFQLVIEAPRGGYFRLVGLAPESEQAAYLAEFRKMAESFEPVAAL